MNNFIIIDSLIMIETHSVQVTKNRIIGLQTGYPTVRDNSTTLIIIMLLIIIIIIDFKV